MRILLLNDHATPMGGAELQVLRLRELLGEAGHEVRLLASRASTLPGPVAADRTCFGTVHPRLRVATQTANPSAAWALRRELAAFRPDVVHVRMFLTQLSPLILPVLREVPALYQAVFYKAICPLGTKLLPDGSTCQVPAGRVCMRTGCVTPQTWVLDMAQQRLWQRWRGAFDAVTTLSAAMRRRLEEAGIGPVHVIPNGAPRREPRPPLTGPPLVVFAGRLVREKGADVLVRAFAGARLHVPDARLLLAGQGPELEPLRRLAAELGVADRVDLPGHLPREELERRFDAAWVQAVPGRWEEPLGNVTLEAMARGTALVVTDIGGPAELVDPGRTGLLVAPGEVEPLRSALVALLTDRERAEALGAAARATALAEHSEGRLVERLEAVYRSIVPAR